MFSNNQRMGIEGAEGEPKPKPKISTKNYEAVISGKQ